MFVLILFSSGAFSNVYKALDLRTNKKVAGMTPASSSSCLSALLSDVTISSSLQSRSCISMNSTHRRCISFTYLVLRSSCPALVASMRAGDPSFPYLPFVWADSYPNQKLTRTPLSSFYIFFAILPCWLWLRCACVAPSKGRKQAPQRKIQEKATSHRGEGRGAVLCCSFRFLPISLFCSGHVHRSLSTCFYFV